MKNPLIATVLFIVALGCALPAFGQSNISFATGTFTSNSVLAKAGAPSEEIYGVTLDNSSAETTSNGYSFGADTSSNTNFSYNVSGGYSTFLSGGGTSGDTALDAVLNHGRVGPGTGTLTLNNLTQGVTYQVLFLEADTRSAENGRTFSVTLGSVTGASQQYAFTGGTPALGGYALCTFTATGTNATFTVNNAYGYQLNGILVCCVGSNTPLIQTASGTFSSNAVLAGAGNPVEEIYGVSLGNSSAETTSNGYSFSADTGTNTNFSYNVSGAYYSFLSGGGTSGDTALDAVLNHGRVGSGNGTLTLNNLAHGVIYRVLLLEADTRSAENGRTFGISQGGDASTSQQYAFAGGTSSVGGYILCTFMATGMTETFTVNNAYGYQLNGILVCCVGANTPFKTIEAEWGNLSGQAAVVSLPAGTLPTQHTETLEASGRAYVHLTAPGDSVTLTNNTSVSANAMVVRACIPDAPAGYGINATLDMYVNGVFREAINLTSAYTWVYNSNWTDKTPGSGPAQRFFDEARTFISGAAIAPGSTITFKIDSGNTASFYDIDCIELENVGPAMTQPANTLSVTSYGAVAGTMTYSSTTQQYAYVGGSPSLGGYALCTFTATGTTQSFTVNNANAGQLDGLLVCTGTTSPPSPLFVTGSFASNTVLALAGSPSQEVYGVSLANSSAETTSNGYSFAADTSSNTNFSYTITGSYSGFLGGGGTSGDSALDAVLNHARVGGGTGILVLNNLTQGVTYQVLFLLADTRTGGENGRTFSITEGTNNSVAFQNCINAAQTAGEGVWIPAGTYYLSQQLNASNITISGAGKWYTTLFYTTNGTDNAITALSTTDCNINNLYLDSNSFGRTPLTQLVEYGVNMTGTVGWVVQNVWVHNYGAAFWMSGTNGTLENCRVGNDWADGINLNNGTTADSAGSNLTCENNFLRGNCDDNIAINAQNGEGTSGNMVNTQVLNNTSVVAVGASCLSIYGGNGTVAENNLLCDPAEFYGLHGGTFGTGGNPLQSVLIQDNVVIRGLGFKNTMGAISFGANATNVTVNGNIDYDSLGAGIALSSCTASFSANVIYSPAAQGVWITSGSTGSAVFQDNTLVNLSSGQNAFENDSTSTFPTTLSGNIGF